MPGDWFGAAAVLRNGNDRERPDVGSALMLATPRCWRLLAVRGGWAAVRRIRDVRARVYADVAPEPSAGFGRNLVPETLEPPSNRHEICFRPLTTGMFGKNARTLVRQRAGGNRVPECLLTGGTVLTAGDEEVVMEANHQPAVSNPQLDRRLNDIGWGLILMLTGTVWLLPATAVPPGTWLCGVGVILVGVNVARYIKHIPVSRFTVAVGIAAFAAAVSPLWRTDPPVVAIFLLVIGGSLVARPLFTRTA